MVMLGVNVTVGDGPGVAEGVMLGVSVAVNVGSGEGGRAANAVKAVS